MPPACPFQALKDGQCHVVCWESEERLRSQVSWQAESPAPQRPPFPANSEKPKPQLQMQSKLVSQLLKLAFVAQAIPPASSLASEVFIPIPKKLWAVGRVESHLLGVGQSLPLIRIATALA